MRPSYCEQQALEDDTSFEQREGKQGALNSKCENEEFLYTVVLPDLAAPADRCHMNQK